MVKFISVLGKPGKYANDERPLIRKWRVIAASENNQPPSDDADWAPAYIKVSGLLPSEDLPPGEVLFVRGFVDILAPGAVRLDVNSTKDLALWIDGRRIEELPAPIRLDRGRRVLTFSFRPQQRKTGLRVELQAAGDAVKFQPVGGW